MMMMKKDLSSEEELESLLIFTPSGGTKIQYIEDMDVNDDEDEGFIFREGIGVIADLHSQ